MSHSDVERSVTRKYNKKRNNELSSTMANQSRAEIPPPHITTNHHHQSQIYQPNETNDDFQYRQTATSTALPLSEVHYGQFMSEHEIKFTKNEICSPSTCICFFIALLCSFMAIMSGIYFGLSFFDGKHLKERVFKAQFVVSNQEFLSSDLENSESREFKTLSSSLQQKIDRLFKESSISKSYIKCEIIAFERKRISQSDVVVHFNVHTAANKQNIEIPQIYLIIAEEILNNKLKIFDKWSIDYNSLDIQERKWIPQEKTALLVNPWTYKSMFPGMLEGLSTDPTPEPRKCMNIGLNYCRFLSYNQTSYPNLLNHWNLSSVEEDFITYKEIIDSECYALAKEFLCTLLQPECVDDEVILPCKHFCIEFYNACRRWLPEKVANKLICSTFPDYQIKGKRKYYSCRSRPNCSSSLSLQSQNHKLCDGVSDCPDQSDEVQCAYCGDRRSQFSCGNRQCVPNNVTCDGFKDCKNGADEMNCLTLLPRIDGQLSPKEASFSNVGYLLATFKGRSLLVCGESALSRMQNYSHIYYNNQLQILGLNICNEHHFEELIRIESKHTATNGPFSKLVPGSTLISPYTTQCNNREVYHVECAVPKCGLNYIQSESELSATNNRRKAFPGYWPWYAKINLNGNYLCDGTLVSDDTVLAQSTCFADSRHEINYSNVSVLFASVRYQVDNMDAVKSKVSSIDTVIHSNRNQKLSTIKLANPVKVSSKVRPICHNHDIVASINDFSSLQCSVLNLSFESDELQYRQAKVVHLNKCRLSERETTATTTTATTGPSIYGHNSSHDKDRGKLCVQIVDDHYLSYHHSNQCDKQSADNCSVAGRHLYCRFKYSWYLFAVEHRLIYSPASGNATLPIDAHNSLLLFQTLPKLSH